MVAGISKLASLPVSLPITSLPENVDTKEVANQFSEVLSHLGEPSAYAADAVWRDTFALTETLRSFYSAQGIAKAWNEACKESAHPVSGSFTVIPAAARVMNLPNRSSWVEVSGTFVVKTKAGLTGKCSLMLSVVPSDTTNGWKIWTVRTVLDEVEEWPSVNHYSLQPINGTAMQHQMNVQVNDRIDCVETPYFDVAIIGGGQAGLSVAGRLQALNIQYVLLDKYHKVGDSWATRYDSARLHTIREYSHLPFDRTFPKDQYQEFLTKDDLARGYRDWTKRFGIDDHIWTEAEMRSGVWEGKDQRWTLTIIRRGQEELIRCRFVVMATGAGGQIPHMPDLPGRERYTGIILHSQDYRSSKPWKGLKGIVVGTANTAHDIADDMLEAGLESTTMVQRSTTYILPCEYWQKFSSRTYNDNIPTELADKLQMTGPNAVGRLAIKTTLDSMAAEEPQRFDKLTKAGFLTERYGDLMWHLLERGGGHYMDVGTSKKIADGKINIKSNASATHYTATGLGFDDGTEIAADVIVWSTGFEVNIRDSIARLFGDQTAQLTGDFFGIDEEGEIKGAWRIKHPGLITHGMALGQARFFSKYIALQIKAVLEGKPFHPYLSTPIPPRTAPKQ